MATGDPSSGKQWLAAELDRLLDFVQAARDRDGGFCWLDLEGRPDRSRPVEAWITCRMTHVFALAEALGRPGAMGFVAHGVEALDSLLRDKEYGGWYAAAGHNARTDKQAYDHAFVVLAAASATSVGATGAAGLLDEALDVVDRRFWRDDDGLGAAAALGEITGEHLYTQWQATWWAFARTYFIDERGGSWWHQLDPTNRPARSVWPGKPDAYHAVQTTLLPRFPLTASVMHSVLLGAHGT
jgi:mannose/cellobiose epimerase-like protein (N-acyl-D-glucosamine 2-epimerase family)